MVTANISVLGLYVYDPTIFDGLAVPEGVNRETVVQNLLAELSGLEIIYPDAEFMRRFIPIWSSKELPVWQKLYNTTVLEYDPIMNYDRTEEWTEKRTGNDTFTGKLTSNNTFTGKITDTGTYSGEFSASGNDSLTDNTSNVHNGTSNTNEEHTSNSETINKVAAYNSSNLENKDSATANSSNSSTSESESTSTDTKTATIKNDTTRTESAENSASNEQNTENSGNRSENVDNSNNKTENVEVKRRAFGNIGVTTTQQMIGQERESALFNIYDTIIQSFKYRFCVLVY